MKIGTAKITLNNGKIVDVQFDSNITVKLNPEELNKFTSDEDAGRYALSKWFSDVERTELADRTKYKIEEKKNKLNDSYCEIQYELVAL